MLHGGANFHTRRPAIDNQPSRPSRQQLKQRCGISKVISVAVQGGGQLALKLAGNQLELLSRVHCHDHRKGTEDLVR